ncbi:MAG: carboxypeptidase-like regulatory domain-containing protein [Bacteroidota bacterium]|nr:carboxypeptidase-like regulatory domain-containing protein [Bacteroidota bacterium]
MIHRISIILFFYAIFFTWECKPQNGEYEIKGCVTDFVTKEPMPGVTIADFMSGKGVVTNEKGEFNYSFEFIPVWFKINHLGYQEEILAIESFDRYNDSIKDKVLTIDLKKDLFQLEEVTVTQPGTVLKLFKKEPFAIIDYQIKDEIVIALIYRNNNPLKKEILLSDLKGSPIYTATMPGAQEIFRDCRGDIFVVKTKKIIRADIIGHKVFFHDEIDRDYFDAYIRPIKVIRGKWMVSMYQSENGQFHEYNLVNVENKSKRILHRVGSRGREMRVKGLDRRHTQINRQIISKGHIESGELRILNKNMDNAVFQISTNYPPVNSSLFSVGDSLLLFDFDQKLIRYYHFNGECSYQSSIKVNLNADWTGRIHQDRENNRYYLEFLHIHSTYLVEIDPGSGEKLRQIPINNYRHIDHLKVINNRIFFLHQPDFGNELKQLVYINI